MVFAVAVAIKVARVEEAIVTALLFRLTTPVKSSIRSSWPAARLEFARGRVNALRTLLLVKSTTRLPPEMDTALAKLRSMPMPVPAFGETVKETVATALLEAGRLRGQAGLAGGVTSAAS